MGEDHSRKLQCSLCHRLFRRNEHLARHERSRKSCSCRRANTRTLLTRPDRNERPFSCRHCEARFTRKDLIKGHMARHHKDKTDQGDGQSSLPEATTGTASYDTYYQPDSLPQLWETPAPGSSFDRSIDLDDILANAEVPLLAYFDNEGLAYPQINVSQTMFQCDTPSRGDAPDLAASAISSRPPNAAPTAESSWQTSFDIGEDKRAEIGKMMKCVMQSVSSNMTPDAEETIFADTCARYKPSAMLCCHLPSLSGVTLPLFLMFSTPVCLSCMDRLGKLTTKSLHYCLLSVPLVRRRVVEPH